MLRDALRSLLSEPPATNPPARGWRDWFLFVGFATVAVLEIVFADPLVWPVVSFLVTVGLLPLVLWRRTHPLACIVVVFGVISACQAASVVTGDGWVGLNTTVYVLLFPYSLLRWGSGRAVALGLPVVSLPLLLTGLDQRLNDVAIEDPVSSFLGGALVLLLSAAFGASVRYRERASARTLDQAKLLEREQLARELHDSVAHHVSAIAIRAQAGRMVAKADPDAALDALLVIEEEASRTLSEMRAMVGALRQGTEADLAPQQGVADIERLTRTVGDGPTVTVELVGDLAHLRPVVDAALYRLAQEAITNALRHARNATRVDVAVIGDINDVCLTVADDGDVGAFDTRSPTGFGLIGMAERAKLVGGTFHAGPERGRGWAINATIPRGVEPS